MQLDHVAVAIRSRRHWEAIDLGFHMARHWWRPFYAAWFATLLPILLLTHILTWGHWQWVPMIIWWLKPVFERPILYVASHAVFGELPTLRETLRQTWTQTALPRLLWELTLARPFLFARSFNLAVWQLEGLRGKTARERVRMLGRGADNAPVLLTWAVSNMELLGLLVFYGVGYLLLPEGYRDRIGDWFSIDRPEVQLIQSLMYLFAVSLVGPFYVAGGFALYLNRRTQLEGWDIELAFRRLAERLEQQERT